MGTTSCAEHRPPAIPRLHLGEVFGRRLGVWGWGLGWFAVFEMGLGLAGVLLLGGRGRTFLVELQSLGGGEVAGVRTAVFVLHRSD